MTGSGGSATDVHDDRTGLAMIGAAAAVTAWGSSGVIIKNIDMDGLAISVYRFWVYAIVFVAWLRIRGVVIDRRVLWHSLPGGIALGLDVALFFSAVKQTTVVNATVIGALQPLVVGLVAWRFFGERMGRRNIVLGGVALVATVVVVFGSSGTPEWNLRGDLLAVGALFSWSAYFVFSKGSRAHLTPAEFTAGTAVITAAINTPLAIGFGQDLSWPTAESWAWLFVLGIGAGIVGHSVMNWSLVRIPLWLGSVFTLLIPVIGSAMAWALLDEPLTTVQIGAIAVVLLTLAVIIRDETGAPVRAPAGDPASADGLVAAPSTSGPAGPAPTPTTGDSRSS